MSNVYRVNITCPRCQFRGDIESDFPCGHEDLLSRAERAEKERDALIAALREMMPLAIDRASHLRGEWPNAAVDSANADAINRAAAVLRRTAR